MSQSEHIRALILPFERDLLPLPERCFLIRAEASEVLDHEWRARLVCEQSFKPAADRLRKAGFQVVDRLTGEFPAGLCLLTKHKAENRANIARAWSLLAPGGLLVCSGANALGAGSIEREVERTFSLDGHLSKHQARTFWLTRPIDDAAPPPAILTDWLTAGGPQPVGDSGFVARAGCFSTDHVDTGSRILAECFPDGIAGRVADLGAGWGYLGIRLLEHFPAITGLDLFEAEALALADAKTNVETLTPQAAGLVRYHWRDVCAGLPEVSPPDVLPYDWIISNPPFHDGRRADPAIGQAFITSAWKAIRRRGKFLLVANQNLPYEAELRRRFRIVEQIRVDEGFKVYLSTNRHDR
ncbi:MAG: methyltransferase [Phaeospirillum sp.]|nr:methyltransferase [Phaeospirillum sp.]